MTTLKTCTLAAVSGGALLCASAHAAPMIFTDSGAMTAGLSETHVETFESMGSGAVTALSFSGAVTAPVTTFGVTSNAVFVNADPHGAVSNGPGRFWRLRAGTTLIDFGSSWDAFGFWYSDLEVATLIVSLPELGFSTQLDDNNPGVNHFFGVRSDAPFTRVSIAWSVTKSDSVGFDDMIVGRAVPAPGTGALAAISFMCVASVRGRGRKRRREGA